ncbi:MULTISPECIES: hypothetical protein [unclassified Ensifer]|uniref:hypothetical protein n=1 Tax=unclassified Ensifer TaxID=2633371 RepID=UPI0008139365|nr:MULTISPECIES: hypothetical protein [unclassified Ensifer]OCP18366.1 hypothetical protein BC361_06825 [Ensifer sp. LC54]OCP27461.1 hypothetical protein BC363_13205 [Ensifer sp. LC384]
MSRIKKRVVLHFPGFEPFDAEAHRLRYARSAQQSAEVWDFKSDIGPLVSTGAAAHFDVDCAGSDWQTSSRIHLFDHDVLVDTLSRRSFVRRLAGGFASALHVAFNGGLWGYFRHAWRFALFSLFPFLMASLMTAATLVVAFLPNWLNLSSWNLLWSLPLAGLLMQRFLLPLASKFHTLHLFADWEMAVALARLDRPEFNRWLDSCVNAAREAFNEEADEYLISSHSMGSSVAAHVIGMLLERQPDILAGKRVVFATLGGAILQCALMRPAQALRARVGAIARAREIFWFEVHCLTDVVNFYKTRVVTLSGHSREKQPPIAYIKVKHLLSPDRYRRIRRNFLRVHRQYVLGPDVRASFDFTLMTAGPLPAAAFADFSRTNMPTL